MAFRITPYHSSDLAALYRICLYTGFHGEDASQLYQDPDLLGHNYAAPYAISEPDLCFVLSHNSTRCGYVLGTRDTQGFNQWCEDNWLPHLRERYAMPEPDDDSPDAHLIRLIHQKRWLNEVADMYPAHLHIDLLPIAQGQGLGHKMMETFLNGLRDVGVKAVHLGASQHNPRAVRFYEKEGFERLKEYGMGITFGMILS